MTATDAISSQQQFLQVIRVAKKLTTVANVGKIASESLFYGNNNVHIALQPLIADAIGRDSHLKSDESLYYFLFQEEIFGMVPIDGIVKFRDEHDKHIPLPQYITDIMNEYENKPYWQIAIDIKNLYTEYANKKNINRSIEYMIYLDQLLFELPKFGHNITISGTCGKYTIEDNSTSGSVNLLRDILKRKDSQILHEMGQHVNFDPNDRAKRNIYHTNHYYIANDKETVYKMAYLYKLKNPSGKPGQIYCGDFTGGAAIFYVSLFQEDRECAMAQQWLMEHGFFDNQFQETLLFKFGSTKPMDITQ
eukprot:17366_1